MVGDPGDHGWALSELVPLGISIMSIVVQLTGSNVSDLEPVIFVSVDFDWHPDLILENRLAVVLLIHVVSDLLESNESASVGLCPLIRLGETHSLDLSDFDWWKTSAWVMVYDKFFVNFSLVG